MIDAAGMPDGWDADPPRFSPDDDPIATRKASEAAIQWAAKAVPHLIGGSADLATSNNTDIDDAGDVEKGSYGGRNLRFGVREHGMGAIVNGLSLHGFRAYGATFLTFSDYMRGALRLSALMKLPSIWVYTHDSIGLGEDGPTHQPIEQLAGLRAMPRLNVVRPADANETVLGWRFALRQNEAPTAFALSRQNLPILDPDAIPDDAIERGAYILRQTGEEGAQPDLILIGTGSEVSLCLEAAELLERVQRPGRLDAVHGHVRPDRRGLPAPRAAAGGHQPDRGGGGEPGSAGTGGSGRRAGSSAWRRSASPGRPTEVYRHFGITADEVAHIGRELIGQMSATTGVNERLAQITSAGTSVWLDQIRRSLIEGGELERMVSEESLRGVTANPVDLREGDPRLGGLRRRAARDGRRGLSAPRRSTTGSPSATSSSPPTC